MSTRRAGRFMDHHGPCGGRMKSCWQEVFFVSVAAIMQIEHQFQFLGKIAGFEAVVFVLMQGFVPAP
jgi:hypothetical protein